MAAHQLTGILQVMRYLEGHTIVEITDYLQPALDYRCWTEQNDKVWYLMEDWVKGATEIDLTDHVAVRVYKDKLRVGLILLLPDVIGEWDKLNRPSCMEDWMRQKYGEIEDANNHTD